MKYFWKYIFPCLFALIIYTTVRLVNDFTAETKFWRRPAHTTIIEVGSTIIIAYIIQYMLNYFIRKFSMDKANEITGKRIAYEFGTILLWSFIIINLTAIPVTALTDDGLSIADFLIDHIIVGLYVLLYFAIVRGNIYLKEYVQQRLQLEKIANDHLQTELKFLKAQYHPHFLFNALNTIYFQMDENVGAAKKSVEKFSELLRYQLYDQQQTVPISQELEYLNSFIELQKQRSSEKLDLTINLEKSLKSQQVYPLLFLPFVENAFKYVGGEYKIHIEASNGNDELYFRVKNSIPRDVPPQRKGGIGLENIRRRLELLYPGKHQLVIRKDKEDFVAELTLTLH